MKLACSAVITNVEERKAIMAWIRSVNPESYSEIGNTVSMTYVSRPDDPDDSSRYWGIVHVFEGYSEHSISQS